MGGWDVACGMFCRCRCCGLGPCRICIALVRTTGFDLVGTKGKGR